MPLWRFVSCRGFLAEGETGVHPVWKGAVETGSVLNMPIKELLKLKMDLESYIKTVSDEDISSRLPKMQKINSPELKEVASALIERKRAGYQEGVVNQLIDDIKKDY
ncbi:hypothetical protein J7E79_13445 [Bacillus sp. ISL-40]|uniref:hypothetical protein n=1 Tax=unclassified Bacillus (in: firmicutes) TaxID=185979 RepID=UPI001BE84A87|nr:MULTISPECIES: hypothetical protein [unclassified Bacillus (in: firmicutes)]MBT2698416.1 hypothetical protein [Bacillus sp. ISL-40]MBT2722113.1 hypothetical protein [Bacillus sp. ISL-46]MBT2740598.1 hypothetical protein [Bacillus sp. ISL-77]